MQPTFKDTQEVFNEAINKGILSKNESDSNFAGNFMYMGTYDNKDQFKNIITRKYL